MYVDGNFSNRCPVTDQPCVKPATFTISETVGNKTLSTTCCRDCASKYCEVRNNVASSAASGAQGTAVFSLSDLFSKILNSQIFDSDSQMAAPATKRCPMCSSSMSDILSAGKLGCSHCYVCFANELSSHISKCQAGMQHKGKSPKNNSSLPKPERAHELEILEAALKSAIEDEDYDRAAYCRDKIAEIKSKS